MNFTLIAIVIGVGVPVIGGFIWLAFRNAEKRGKAESEAAAAAKVNEINSGMVEIQSQTRTPSETVDRMRTGKFGGQK